MSPPFTDVPDLVNTDQALDALLPDISIVVPCHNEADSLDRLAEEMVRLRVALCATRWS